MSDPYDDARRFLKMEGFEKLRRRCEKSGLYRYCAERWSRVQDDFSALSSTVDFKSGGFLESQIVSGVYESDESWRWMSQKAVFVVRAPDGSAAPFAELYFNKDMFGGKSITAALFIDGEIMAVKTISDSAVVLLEGPPLDLAPGRVARLAITASDVFIPARVRFGDKDQSKKSFLVGKAGLRTAGLR
jgi:hypothetical protein